VISFCCALKNRGFNFVSMLESFSGLDKVCDFELVVTDFDSDDFDVGDAIESSVVSGSVVKLSEAFNRSRGLNFAFDSSCGDSVFFVDADMFVPVDFLNTISKNVEAGKCYFPICYSLHPDMPMVVSGDNRRPGESNGWWRDTGKGVCGFCREDFEGIGKWDEMIGSNWGLEDKDIFKRSSCIEIVRENCDGLFHLWHPDDNGYKGRYHDLGYVYAKRQGVQIIRKRRVVCRLRAGFRMKLLNAVEGWVRVGFNFRKEEQTGWIRNTDVSKGKP